MNEKLKSLKERTGKFFSVAGKVSIILISMIVGFYINEVRRDRKAEKTTKHIVEEHMPVVRSPKETSVAINERGEIIVIDRKNGSYEIYSDSVGLMIFNHYASKMYLKANQ